MKEHRKLEGGFVFTSKELTAIGKDYKKFRLALQDKLKQMEITCDHIWKRDKGIV